MSPERRREYPLKAAPSTGRRVFPPDWYLALRLRWTRHAIARLEQQLSGEFGTLDTAPLQRELADLISERDTLLRRLDIAP